MESGGGSSQHIAVLAAGPGELVEGQQQKLIILYLQQLQCLCRDRGSWLMGLLIAFAW